MNKKYYEGEPNQWTCVYLEKVLKDEASKKKQKKVKGKKKGRI